MTHLTNFNCQATEMIHQVDSSSDQLLEISFRTVRNKRKKSEYETINFINRINLGILATKILECPWPPGKPGQPQEALNRPVFDLEF